MARPSKKIMVIFGTRPEIIKLSVLVGLLEQKRMPYTLVHTGQHYSYPMDRLFFKQLRLPQPGYRLSIRSKRSGVAEGYLGRMMHGLESILLKERPAVVVLQGDTNTVLAGALVASKIDGVKIAHVEAGLRSYDRRMPEEVNRVVCDHVSDYLFAPTKDCVRTLLGEGVNRKNIVLTGNTIVDAVFRNRKIASRSASLPARLRGKRTRFILMTLHRQENVDNQERLSLILEGIGAVAMDAKLPIIFPVHPRTLARLHQFGLKIPAGVEVLKPVGFMEFLQLEQKATLILTDSGGIQEEACILNVPCVTLRTNTERPETIRVGSNLLAGYHPEAIRRCAMTQLSRRSRIWKNPYGDGRASERILSFLRKELT